MTIEAAAGMPAPQKKKFLPNKILRAIDEVAQLQGLTAGVRTTLLTICRYVKQQDPLGAVFTRKAKIAGRAGLSERTIHRHIVKLESLGLVHTEDQRHGQKNGKFLVTHVFLTEKLAQMVGLIDSASPTNREGEGTFSPAPSDKMAAGHIKSSLTKPSSTKEQGRPARNGQGAELTIPADLKPLLELGMWPQTICKLMREAKDNGKLLSDILTAVRKRLVELKLGGKQIATYLRKAIASKTDFAVQAKAVADQERQEAQKRAERTLVADFRTKYAGKVLRSPDGRETVAIHRNGEHAQHQVGPVTGVLPLATGSDVAYLVGKIERGLLVEGAGSPSITVASAGTNRSSTVGQHLAKMRELVGLRRVSV